MEPPKIRQALVKEPVATGFLVLTLSDTRTEATDQGGRLAVEYLEANGHRVVGRRIVRDEPAEILAVLQEGTAHPDLRVFLLTGGTGISRRDSTFEAVRRWFDTEITGFGELFRWLSYLDIGTPAMLSRATAGVKGRQVLFSLPGSPAAVRLALEKLVLPEVGHILHELDKQP